MKKARTLHPILAFILFQALSVIFASALAALEPDAPIATDKKGVALDGYDMVAYLETGKGAKGKSEWASKHRNVTWYFSSSKNKSKFDADPEKYMPEYGGYCVFAIAVKKITKGYGKYGEKRNGKLYFNADWLTQKRYLLKPTYYIEKAEKNWPEIKQMILSK